MLAQRAGQRFDRPVSVELYYFCGMPKSWSGKKKQEMEGQPRGKKPDIDNYEKFIYDCMNGIIIEDDSIIVEVYQKKVYSKKPCTLIIIKPYKHEPITKPKNT